MEVLVCCCYYCCWCCCCCYHWCSLGGGGGGGGRGEGRKSSREHGNREQSVWRETERFRVGSWATAPFSKSMIAAKLSVSLCDAAPQRRRALFAATRLCIRVYPFVHVCVCVQALTKLGEIRYAPAGSSVRNYADFWSSVDRVPLLPAVESWPRSQPVWPTCFATDSSAVLNASLANWMTPDERGMDQPVWEIELSWSWVEVGMFES